MVGDRKRKTKRPTKGIISEVPGSARFLESWSIKYCVKYVTT